jgi:predicted transcriptional regulator
MQASQAQEIELAEDVPSKPTAAQPDLLAMTGEIVAAFVAANTLPAAELPGLIDTVFTTLSAVGQPAAAPKAQEPAVPIRRSVTPGYIVCLEDGKKLKMLKRHLRSTYGMTPEAYRAKWGLPHDYPMVAPDYAERRSEFAKSIGLGRRKAAEPEPTPAPAKRGRRKAA